MRLKILASFVLIIITILVIFNGWNMLKNTTNQAPKDSVSSAVPFAVVAPINSSSGVVLSNSPTSAPGGSISSVTQRDTPFEKVTVNEYNGVSVDVLIDNNTFNKVDKNKSVNVIVAYRGTSADSSKNLSDSEKFIEMVRKITPVGNNIIVSVVYPEGEKIAGGNIKEAEAGLLWVKNKISSHLGITLGKVLLVGHSQGAYLVSILNTMQQVDGVVSNSPGPLNLQLLCERIENGAYAKGDLKNFTCDTIKKQYGSVTVNPQPYIDRSLLLSFVSGYKANTLFVQGMEQTGIQIELWPLFKKSVQLCSNCAKVEFLDVLNGTHAAGFFVPDAIAREKAFLNECIGG